MTPELTNRERAERICIEANIYPRGNLANAIENALDDTEQRTLQLNKSQVEKLQASRDTAWASEQRLAAQCLRMVLLSGLQRQRSRRDCPHGEGCTMTEEELAEIEARAEAVSANLFTPDALHAESLKILWLYDNFDIGVEPNDGAFLVHARADVLALIAEVRRREEGAVQVGKMVARLNTEMNELQAENEKLRAALDKYGRHVYSGGVECNYGFHDEPCICGLNKIKENKNG